MFPSDDKVKHKAKRVVAHVKKHQNTYLFFGGLAGGTFFFVKIIMLFGASYMLYNASHDTIFADDYVLTNEPVVEVLEEVENVIIEEEGEQDQEEGSQIGEELENIEESLSDPIQEIEEADEPVVEEIEEVDESIEEVENVIIEEEGEQDQEEYGFETTPLVCDYSGFSSNITGLGYSGIMDMSWTISSVCENENVEIQLYDHNEEWITLTSIPGTTKSYSFDTKLLGSGFYLETGLNASGEIITIIPELYSGIASNSWTGYYIRWLIQPDTILHQTEEFVIDNEKPSISNVSLSSSGNFSGNIGVGKNITIKFDESELLTGINVLIGSSQAISISGTSSGHYEYVYSFPLNYPSGKILYSISYQDLVGNTGSTTGLSEFIYDGVFPQITGFNLSGYEFSFITSESTLANAFVIIKDTTNGWSFAMTGSSNKHSFLLPTLSLNTNYDLGIVVQDNANNESKAALALRRNGSGDIQYTLLATLYGETLTNYNSGYNFLTQTGDVLKTGDLQNSMVEKFKKEIDKFTECKNNIDYTKVRIQIKGSEIELNIPSFKRAEIKKLVNSFVLYILKNSEKKALSEVEFQDLAKNFDNFVVILKLLKDDDNSCKQNLSNYHLEQFKQSLDTYGIEF